MIDRIICGWRVRSSLPLPETLAWCGADRPVDVEIRQGAVPAHLEKRASEVPYIEVSSDGRLLVHAMPGVDILVTSDCVVVDTELAPGSPIVRAFLLGPVLAVLCYLRGILPLHAAVVRIGNRAIAIAGRSGAGKSTIAAGLSYRGYALVTDDICACAGLPERPLVLPTYPAIKLSLPSLQALDIDPDGLTPMDSEAEKFQLPRLQGFDPKPIPLEAIYLIENAPEGVDEAIIAATGADAFARLSAEIYRPPIGRLLLGKTTVFAMVAELASRVAIHRLIRRPGFTKLQALIDMIEASTAQT